MKPNEQSIKALYKTQSIAKMIEFEVPPQERNVNIKNEPERLFPLALGILEDLCIEIKKEFPNQKYIDEQELNLRFCASFFDSYKNSQRLDNVNDYLLLVGAACYYLSNLPGSTQVLIKKININTLDLCASGMEKILIWLLNGKYNLAIDFVESDFSDQIQKIYDGVKYFFDSGEQSNLVIEACKKLSNLAYCKGNDRELFFSDLIYAVCIKKIRNSCWMNLPTFSGLSKESLSAVIRKKNFIKELWPSQLLLGKEGVFRGQSAVIQMPTSAGKTKSTEIIIRSAFLGERTNVAVLVAPFKALCHEIERDYYFAFRGDRNVSIDEINDALESTDVGIFSDSVKKHIVILTPEKLYYLLSQQQNFAEKIGLIIFDEGHQFDSGERGVTYELLLTELKRFLPTNCQRILISAVIHNVEQISSWLSSDSSVVKGNKALPTERSVGVVDFRYEKGQIRFINPLKIEDENYFVPRVIDTESLPLLRREKKERIFPDKNDSNSIALALALKMSRKENVAVFCGKKDSVNVVLNLTIDLFNRLPKKNNPKCDSLEKNKLSYLIEKNLGNLSDVYKAAQHCVFAHHADIPHGIKMAVEFAMHKSLISFIVCTSTLAQGVNLPIKYLFISSTQQGGDRIKVRDFHNLIGRVGRAGKLTEGCIIFTNPKIYEERYYRNQIANLLNPENSEDCTSSLLKIFEPLRGVKESLSFKTVNVIIDLYYDRNQSIEAIAQRINSRYNSFDISSLKTQISIKFQYIEKIENFLMQLGENVTAESAIEIAKSTLAYQIADELQKQEIENLFCYIVNKIGGLQEEKSKLPIFAKTLRGLNQTIDLKNKLNKKISLLKSSVSIEKLFEILWDLFIDGNIQNNYFNCYADKEKLKKATSMWMDGISYSKIYEFLKGAKINGRDYIKVESCVNMFENGVAYSGSVLVNAISEIIKSFENPVLMNVIDLLELFQKRIKYGLPTIESILIYELGFCDRIIAQEISLVVDNAKEKYSMKNNIIEKQNEVFHILEKYPSYYSSVMDRLVS